MKRLVLLFLCGGLFLARPALAQDKKPGADADMAVRMKWAIDHGAKWLIKQQQADGSWTYPNAPMKLSGAYPMSAGVTALCAYALMKAGIGPSEPSVRKAFQFIYKADLGWTYEVSCVLLAIEAKATFDPAKIRVIPPGASSWTGSKERKIKKKKKKRKKRKGRLTAQDIAKAKQCVAWLVKHQRSKGMWRYSGGSDEDASNAQYAMLALDAAQRLKLKVPMSVYAKAARRLIEWQDKGKNEKVKLFPVPGADSSYRQLRKVEAKLRKEIRKIEKKFKRKKEDKKGRTADDHMRSAERKASGKVIESMKEKGAMYARGWAYFPPEASDKGQAWKKKVTGSMTTSCLAALFICKSRMEGTGVYERELKPKLNKALRDGAAWMAKYFSISENPNHPSIHHYYYLYGLERAGILGCVQRFGNHDWFDLGVKLLLREQHADGRFLAKRTTSGPVPDTCFALLFLSRGTTPVVRLPGRVVTGSSRGIGR